MASSKRWVLSRIPPANERALDLGGGAGELREPLINLGYSYVNVDLSPSGADAVVGDAHALPFADASFELVVSSDSLEHFHTPLVALKEVHRVLTPGGMLVVWVPFMHPFHSSDYYRYTPLGIRHLMESAGLQVESLEAPLGPVTIIGEMAVAGLWKLRLPVRWLRQLTRWTDQHLGWHGAYAPYYLMVARRP